MGENCECFIQAQVNIGKGGVVCGVPSKKRHLRSKSWGEGRWDRLVGHWLDLKPKWNAVIVALRPGYGEEGIREKWKMSRVVKASEKWGDLFIEPMSCVSLTRLSNSCQCPFWMVYIGQAKKSWFLIIDYITKSFCNNRSTTDLWPPQRNKFCFPKKYSCSFSLWGRR